MVWVPYIPLSEHHLPWWHQFGTGKNFRKGDRSEGNLRNSEDGVGELSFFFLKLVGLGTVFVQ